MWRIGSFAASLPVRTRSTPSAIACATVSHFSARAIPRPRADRAVAVQSGADDPADRRVLEHRHPNDLVPKARDPETVAVDSGRLHPTHVRLHSLGCPRHGRRDIVTRLFAQAPDLVDYARVVVLGQCEEPNSLIAPPLARLVGHR